MKSLLGHILCLILAAVRYADAIIPVLPPCTSGVLGVLVPILSAQPPVQSFCASKFPQTPITTTATAPTVTSTITVTVTVPTSTETSTATEETTVSITGLPNIVATFTETETSTVTSTETLTSTQTICSRDVGTFPNRRRNLDIVDEKRNGGYNPPVYHTTTSTRKHPVYTTTTKSVSKYSTTTKKYQPNPTTTRKTTIHPTTKKSTTTSKTTVHPTTKTSTITSKTTVPTTTKQTTKTTGDVLTSLSSLKSSVLSSLCSCIATKTTATTTVTPSSTVTTTSTSTPIVTATTTVTTTSTVIITPISTTTVTTTEVSSTTTTTTTVVRPTAGRFTETPVGNTCGCQYQIVCGFRYSGPEPFRRSFSPSNSNECAALCDSEPTCVFADYAFNVGLCILFDNRGGQWVNDADFSAIARNSATCADRATCS